MTRLFSTFASLVYLSFVSIASADQNEVYLFNSPNIKSALPELFEAQNLWFNGELVLAGKAFKAIANSPNSNLLVKKYANSKLSVLAQKKKSYSKSFTFSPLPPLRNYKTDTLEVNVSGSTLPFTVTREKSHRDIFKFNQELQFFTWQFFESNPIDLFSLSHTFIINNDNKLTNSIEFSFANKPNVNLKNTLNFKFTKPEGNNGFIKEVGIDTKLLNGRNLFDLSWSKSLMIDQNLTYDQVTKYSISHTLNLDRLSISTSLDLNNFSDKTRDHSYVSMGTEMPVTFLFDNFSLRFQKRFDNETQFLMPRKRSDNLYSLGLKKYLQIGNVNPIISLGLTKNKSNIEIYSFDEVSLDFVLRF